MPFEEAPQPMQLDDIVAPPQKPEEIAKPEREDMFALKPTPDSLELGDAGLRRRRGEVGAVDRSCGRADDEIRLLAVLHQCAQHPGLHRAEAATAGKNERCRHTLRWSQFPSRSLQFATERLLW